MTPYAVTIFLGAFLLFQVQPLIGKYILPWFGGSAAVWTSCMLFFQWLLLAGYLYAHLISTHLRPKTQVIVHFVIMAAALGFLPIIPADSWKPSPTDEPTTRILLLLAACIGLPYFVLATTGPLIQRWFSLNYPDVNPYRLYSLSNVGSLLALLTYPTLVEPVLTRTAQARCWSVGMLIFLIACAYCASRQWRSTAHSPTVEQSSRPPHFSIRLLWMALPAAASIMLLAMTNKMCIDVAVIPFLWIAPLATYLLSFILCFDHPRWYHREFWILALLVALGAICIVILREYEHPIMIQIGSFCALLLASCMVCHGELFSLKPSTDRLTAYYLMIAAGGAIGGFLVAVIAPLIFTSYYEFHASILLVILLTLTVHFIDPNSPLRRGKSWWASGALALVPFGLVALPIIYDIEHTREDGIRFSRNFYGALWVLENDPDIPNKHHYTLMHGSTTHGFQFTDPLLANQPTTYFGYNSGIGLALQALPQQNNRRIGVVGLGTGTMAAHGKPGDKIRIYEIDPAVKEIAESTFTYLADSPADIEIIMGDARLSLENEHSQQFDMLVLDAFSSDAIPVHLITREAVTLYQRHLKPDGVIAFHISNRNVNFVPVVTAVAREHGYKTIRITTLDKERDWWDYGSDWMLLTTNEAVLNHPAIQAAASPPHEPDQGFRIWTDDYSSLFPVLYYEY